MNAVTQTEARAIQAPALEAADPTKNLILVPLSRLVSRPTGRNVRKTPRMSIPELAASIVSLQPHHLPTFLQQCFNILRCKRQQFIDSAVRPGGEFFQGIG